MDDRTPNEETCETMNDAVIEAARWELGMATPDQVEWLCRWVRLRMVAYTGGGWSGEHDDMVEWIAMDLALDDKDSLRICDEAGWPS